MFTKLKVMISTLLKTSYFLFIFSLLILVIFSYYFEPKRHEMSEFFNLSVDDFLTTKIEILRSKKISDDLYILDVNINQIITATSKINPNCTNPCTKKVIAKVGSYKKEKQLEILRYK